MTPETRQDVVRELALAIYHNRPFRGGDVKDPAYVEAYRHRSGLMDEALVLLEAGGWWECSEPHRDPDEARWQTRSDRWCFRFAQVVGARAAGP